MLDHAFVSRNLRVMIKEWHAWLADKATYGDEWRSVPHWCKQIPSRLDIPWALYELESNLNKRQLIRALFVVIDEIYMACEEMENVPSIDKLRSHLLEWHEAEYE
tara:strand:- start:854 stop:1168 length:315 start_codon:yes stop_codon:yes gene_type:complete